MAAGIKAMMPVDAYLVNVIEEERGSEIERTYIALYGEEGQKPLVMLKLNPDGMLGAPATPQMKDFFVRKLEGRELPAMGAATESREIGEGDSDVPSV